LISLVQSCNLFEAKKTCECKAYFSQGYIGTPDLNNLKLFLTIAKTDICEIGSVNCNKIAICKTYCEDSIRNYLGNNPFQLKNVIVN
jgi:hypothetical protein